MEQNRIGIIAPQQLAHIRAQVYARRAVSNEDVAVLLEAYDDLARRLQAVTAETHSPVVAGVAA